MIVCLEGVNGSGKTTLAEAMIKCWLAAGGATARLTEPVQYTEFGRQVRTAIMNEGHLSVEAETLAFASARLHAAENLLRQHSGSDLVVLERWAGAVVAYGAAVGTDAVLLEALEPLLARALHIDYTVLVDTPGAVAHDRLTAESNPNRFENQGPDYLEKVRQEYLAWADRHSVPVVSGTRSVDDATAWAAETIRLIRPW